MHPEWADSADIINMLSAAPFAFLPVLVGFSATKVFGGNPYLGLTMGGRNGFPGPDERLQRRSIPGGC